MWARPVNFLKQFVSRFGRVHTTSLYSITSTIRANLVGGIFQRQHEKWHEDGKKKFFNELLLLYI